MRKLPYIVTRPCLTDITRGHMRLMLVMAKHRPHVRVGETLRIEAPDGRRAVTARCILRGVIALNPDGIVRASEILKLPQGDGLANLLHAAEQAAPGAFKARETLAHLCGIATYVDLYARERARAGRGRLLRREVIGWDSVSETEPSP